MAFQYPLLLTLLLLAPLLWRWMAPAGWRCSAVLRLLLFVLVVGALARPFWRWPSPGTDIVLVVDHSSSCAPEAEPSARELLDLLRRSAGVGDRLAAVGFADGARIDLPFDNASAPAADVLPPEASHLAEGLRRAAHLRDPVRRTAFLVVSDGRYTGVPPADGTVLAELGNTPVWYRNLDRPRGADVAAGPIVLPPSVAARSAWLVRYTLRSSSARPVAYAFSRDGFVLARGTAALTPGDNAFFVRDTADAPGVVSYRLEVSAPDDAIPGNNVALAALRVEGAPRTLVVSPAGEGLLSRSLAAAAIPCDLVKPEAAPAAAALLAPYKLVVLENVRLPDLAPGAAAAIARAVENGLAALWVAGGENSFGAGGYHRSVLDPLLPVEMGLRNEKGRGALALAVALDRSGSMASSAALAPGGQVLAGGRTKMDVANLGVAESIRLLSPSDQVAVLAVDTAAHSVVPLAAVDHPEVLAGAVRRIQSMGGGIFCLTALKAAAAELERSKLAARHLLLFADAADAEEQEGCVPFARDLAARGIGLSVIAMGGPEDRDAGFLRELAQAAGGEALFSERMDELPSLFTQEVTRVSQRGFVKETRGLVPLAPLSGLGLSPGAAFPDLDGYNVSTSRPGAVVFMNVADGFDTPALALRSHGRATAGASLFEFDGQYSGSLARWARTPELAVAFARRLAGGVARADLKGYSSWERGMGTLRVEFSPELARRWRGRPLTVSWLAPEGDDLRSPLAWTGPAAAESRLPLARPGHYLPTVDLGADGVLAAPAASVSYSAEFEPRAAFSGAAALAELAAATGGGEGLDLEAVRRSARVLRPGRTPLAGALMLAAIGVFLAELAGRRFTLFA